MFFYQYTKEELIQLLLPLSHSIRVGSLTAVQCDRRATRWAKQMFQWVYQRLVTNWEQVTDLPLELREWCQEHLSLDLLQLKHSSIALDATHKFLWELADKKTVESVMIPFARSNPLQQTDGERFLGAQFGKDQCFTRHTVCISSQVGCAMKCAFCLTGIQGIDRNLRVDEIVRQIFMVRQQYKLSNIVFMGMGEPLNNLDNVIKACRIFLDQDGFNFSKRKITISTSGLVPKILELGQQLDVSLAVSLNATTDEVRDIIMPVNKVWNISALLEACQKYPLGSHRRITFEYVLIAGMNDSLEDAQRLLQLLKNIRCKINLIPFNEHPGTTFQRPSDEVVLAFQQYLLNAGFTVTVRISRGQDILAACGQLRSSFGSAKGTQKHQDWKALLASSGINAPNV